MRILDRAAPFFALRVRLPRSRQLGLHVRTVAMRSVLGAAPHGGGGGGGAAGALRQEFRAAVEASPCVLHLRGIASLAGEGRTGGVGPVLGQSCLRINRVLQSGDGDDDLELGRLDESGLLSALLF